ncbi:MAG: helix-turn-helix transcriptional regulator [Planktomarina sp.]
MRRADRLFQIIQLLRGGRLVTAQHLAETLEVSKRTIYRDIVDLQGTGVPIDGEAGYGYLLHDGYDLPPLMFNRAEITALVAGARLIRSWGGRDMAKGAEEALVKIEAILDDDLRKAARAVPIHAIGQDLHDETRETLDIIEGALNQTRVLSFGYSDKHGAVTQRQIRPLGLWFWGRTWTTVGWCELREDYRMFRLDRMTDVRQGDVYRPAKGQSLLEFYKAMEDRGDPLPRSTL